MWKTRLIFLICSMVFSFLIGAEFGLNKFVTTKKPHHVALYYACEESCREYDNVIRKK